MSAKLTNDDKVEIYRMRLNGATLQECADRFRVTKEYIRQITPPIEANARGKKPPLADCVYPNLRNWLYDNRHSYGSFARLVGLTYTTTKRSLNGEISITKNTIDRILDAVDMPYEVAFSTKPAEEEEGS